MKAEEDSEAVTLNEVDDDANHLARFSDATIHFTMTTHAGRSLDLKRAVQRLLSADLAVAAAWPSESDVILAPRLQQLASKLEKVEQFRDDICAFHDKGTFGSFLRLLRHHPLLVGRSLMAWRNEASDATGTEEAGLSVLDEAVDLGKDVIFNAQVIAAIERRCDEELFGGRSRYENEFVRLTLRGSYHDIQVPGIAETYDVVFEPRLIIHSSGVVQLTIAVPVDRELTTPQLVELSRSDRATILKSQMAEPLLRGLPAHQLRGRWLEENDAGARLREIVFDKAITIAEELEVHLSAVGAAIGQKIPHEWNTYATMFATAGECCETGHWSAVHQEDVARIVTRYSNTGRIHHEKLIGPNFSLDADSILMSNLASTTWIQTHGEPPTPTDHLNTVLLVEHVLLQYSRLRALEDLVSSSNLFGRQLQSSQHEAIVLFSAMRQYEIRYGTARDIAAYLLTDLGGDDIRRTIETALGLAAQANATRDASVQARRSLALAWVGTVIAVLVAIPTLSEVLDAVKETPEGSLFAALLTPLIWAARFGSWGPWLVVFSILFGVIGWWLLKHLWTLSAAAWRGALRMTYRAQRLPRQYVIDVDLQDPLSILDEK